MFNVERLSEMSPEAARSIALFRMFNAERLSERSAGQLDLSPFFACLTQSVFLKGALGSSIYRPFSHV